MMIADGMFERMGELVAVALKRGLDPKTFVDIMTSTMYLVDARTKSRATGGSSGGPQRCRALSWPLVLKDVRLALAEAGKTC